MDLLRCVIPPLLVVVLKEAIRALDGKLHEVPQGWLGYVSELVGVLNEVVYADIVVRLNLNSFSLAF